MNFTIVAPLDNTLERLLDTVNSTAFNELTISFADRLSQEILLDKQYRAYPELMAVAFWLRKASVHQLKAVYDKHHAGGYRLPRGVVFHIAPSNVDTMFIYSWFLSMLMGNRNIVRISGKLNPQVQLILSLINMILKQAHYHAIRDRLLIVSYTHDEHITAHFSSIADVRVVWGGNETVTTIRKIPLSPRATEITFANKFSFSIISAKAWLELTSEGADHQVKQFYNDAYWFGQMACSSPRMVVWLGEDARLIDKARADFWLRLERCIEREKPDLMMADYVDKLVATHRIAIEMDAKFVPHQDNTITRAWLDNMSALPDQLHCGAGLFFESRIQALPELLPMLSRKVQTISVLGLSEDELVAFIQNHQPAGIDRFVPFGKALAFSPSWDGYNLFDELTREVVILQ